jgi:hypothetical protein
MNLTRIMKLGKPVALVALALCFAAGLGKAQDVYRGTFTLPFEAHWEGAVLPAGDYMISMPAPSARGAYLLYVRGEGKTAIILAGAPNNGSVSDHSQLTIVNTGGNQAITTLEAGQLGWTFDYGVFKGRISHVKNSTSGSEMSYVQVPVRDGSAGAGGR